ncbi:hypothetical protein ACE4RR_21530, partial [Alteribacillus sp. HJP-4]
RTVHKDNVIKFKSNRYTVPLGTYTPFGENLVTVRLKEDRVIISLPSGGEPIAIHSLEMEKGKLVKNTNHSRDRAKGLVDYFSAVKSQFEDQEKITFYLEEMQQRYPLYVRDQLQVFQRAVRAYEAYKEEALEICMREKLWSANDFHDVAKHVANLSEAGAAGAEEISIADFVLCTLVIWLIGPFILN